MKCNCKRKDIVVVRIGNDIEIKWDVFTGPAGLTPYILEGKNISVRIKSKYATYDIEELSVSNNSVIFTFFGKDQEFGGTYSLELVENDGEKEMFTVDECNVFELVRHTCETDVDAENRHLDVRTIEIRTTTQLDTDVVFDVDNQMNLNLTIKDYKGEGVPMVELNEGNLILY